MKIKLLPFIALVVSTGAVAQDYGISEEYPVFHYFAVETDLHNKPPADSQFWNWTLLKGGNAILHGYVPHAGDVVQWYVRRADCAKPDEKCDFELAIRSEHAEVIENPPTYDTPIFLSAPRPDTLRIGDAISIDLRDGQVTKLNGASDDEASRAFWEAIKASYPQVCGKPR